MFIFGARNPSFNDFHLNDVCMSAVKEAAGGDDHHHDDDEKGCFCQTSCRWIQFFLFSFQSERHKNLRREMMSETFFLSFSSLTQFLLHRHHQLRYADHADDDDDGDDDVLLS